jgi:hypothetical protein
MKKRIHPTLAFLALTLFTANLHAVQYKTLMSKGGASSEVITLQEGDIAEVLSLSFKRSYNTIDSYLQITKGAVSLNLPTSFIYLQSNGNYNTTAAQTPQVRGHVIVGPATLQCVNGNCLASLKITTAAELAAASGSQAKYASVVPENLTVNARVRLQQSTDLINWTDVAPGEFAPSANKRFFRVASELVQTAAISGATSANPIVITANAHGFTTGDQVQISGVQGNATANGTFTITVIDANSFSLNGADGSAAGAYVSGGTAQKL